MENNSGFWARLSDSSGGFDPVKLRPSARRGSDATCQPRCNCNSRWLVQVCDRSSTPQFEFPPNEHWVGGTVCTDQRTKSETQGKSADYPAFSCTDDPACLSFRRAVKHSLCTTFPYSSVLLFSSETGLPHIQQKRIEPEELELGDCMEVSLRAVVNQVAQETECPERA